MFAKKWDAVVLKQNYINTKYKTHTTTKKLVSETKFY
jgi:hypothetical protein